MYVSFKEMDAGKGSPGQDIGEWYIPDGFPLGYRNITETDRGILLGQPRRYRTHNTSKGLPETGGGNLGLQSSDSQP